MRTKVSIAVPTHDMDNGPFFISRLIHSLETQTFTDFDVKFTDEEGTMAMNTNAAIRRCKGQIVKVLYMDDYLTSPDSLQKMVDAFNGGWLVTGCVHDDGTTIGNPHIPSYNDQIHTGANTIGSPSVLMFANDQPLLFDERMNWLLDCDLYKRLYARYGPPTIVPEPLVTIGIGPHQTTYKLSDEQKEQEVFYSIAKHS